MNGVASRAADGNFLATSASVLCALRAVARSRETDNSVALPCHGEFLQQTVGVEFNENETILDDWKYCAERSATRRTGPSRVGRCATWAGNLPVGPNRRRDPLHALRNSFAARCSPVVRMVDSWVNGSGERSFHGK